MKTFCHRLLLTAGVIFVLLPAQGAQILFDSDPFAGSTALSTPGRQIVGGEQFIASFNVATDQFVFDPSDFNAGSSVQFYNGPASGLPASGVNVIVLTTTDNDAEPATPFGAGNAANLIADAITTDGAGFFIYHNSGLGLNRLVYSTNLSDNTADLKILARLLDPSGQAAIDFLGTMEADNFAFASPVPEPSTAKMVIGTAVLLIGLRWNLRAAR